MRDPVRIPLGVDLARLEQTDPAVKAAAESYDATVRRILDDRLPHPLPCAVDGCVWHSVAPSLVPAQQNPKGTAE